MKTDKRIRKIESLLAFQSQAPLVQAAARQAKKLNRWNARRR